jgi:multicomponent Na+:H+ antiporter subunit A
MDIFIAVVSVFALALAAPWIHRLAGGATGALLSLLPFSLAVYFGALVPEIASGRSISVRYRWVPSMDVQLSLYLDGLSMLFALLITFIGGLVLVYTGAYLKGNPRLGRFYALITLFMGSMLGLVLADSLLALFLFWELTSISSYLLIGFDHEREAARAGALQALLTTALGGLALLAGFLLLGQITETLELSKMLSAGDSVRAHSLYVPVLLLVLLGAFTKSAQFPFYYWLPNAMEAPTPVSAYLHSATMVKAGVYLLARMSPILSGTDLWLYLITGTGSLTMVIGSLVAFHQTDLKRILAYLTVSALGMLVMLLGMGNPEAVKAALTFLLAHALYKGALFLLAGAVDHETGTRDVRQLGGLGRAMPLTATAAVLAAISMAGMLPTFGFVGKELVYEAAYHAQAGSIWLTVAVVLAGTLFAALALLVGVRPFFGRKRATPKPAHEGPVTLWGGALCLAVLGVLGGLSPGIAGEWILAPAVTAVVGAPAELHLALWHGWTPVFVLSLISGALGLLAFAGRGTLQSIIQRLGVASLPGPEDAYRLMLAGLNILANTQTRILQNGFLRYYLLTIIGTTVVVIGFSLLTRVDLDLDLRWSDIHFYELALAVLILLATLMATFTSSRLGAVAALGVVGFGIALIYILFGAPDLAMTQFLIETLMVILFVLVFYVLPRFAILSSPRARARDGVVAVCAGALMTLFVMIATGVQYRPQISEYFAENSVPRAHGHNIVNVILVDFRALDTLGEITVLALAAVGVYALLKLRLAKGGES